MADVFGFNRNGSPKTVMSTTKTLMAFGTQGSATEQNLVASLIQNWNVTYQNNVTELYELGSSDVYWVRGRPVGNGSAMRVLGFYGALLFPESAYNACDGGITVRISSQADDCQGSKGARGNSDGLKNKPVTITLDGVVVTQLGFSATVADTRFNQNLAWKFTKMEVQDK